MSNITVCDTQMNNVTVCDTQINRRDINRRDIKIYCGWGSGDLSRKTKNIDIITSNISA